jgi:hypothetical protein
MLRYAAIVKSTSLNVILAGEMADAGLARVALPSAARDSGVIGGSRQRRRFPAG